MEKRGAILSWCFYDWAMSAYNTVIGTFIFSVYFTRGVAQSEVIGTAQWGRAVAVSGIAVAVLSPLLAPSPTVAGGGSRGWRCSPR